MTSGIYELKFKNGDNYIGKSVNIEKRWEEHAENMRKGKAARKMQEAYHRCGFPDGTILGEAHPDHLDILESFLIRAHAPSLNTSIPGTLLTERDISILISNSRLLMTSTIEHLETISKLEKSREELLKLLEDYELENEELMRIRDEEEINTEAGKRLAAKDQELKNSQYSYDSLYKRYSVALEELNKPWYKKLFS